MIKGYYHTAHLKQPWYAQYIKKDDEDYNLYTQQFEAPEMPKQCVGANYNAMKAPSKSLLKGAWKALKNLFTKSFEKPKNVTFDDVIDTSKTMYDAYDTYQKIVTPQSSPSNRA